MPDKYDAIIVGGGPAAAMAALVLGAAGCRTLVLERQKLPRYKPCGGGIPANIVAALPAPCQQAVERQVTRVRFLLGHQEVQHRLAGGAIAMVMRDRFDALLLAQAQAEVHDDEGATAVEEGPAGVEVRTARGHYHADYLVGADGASSLVARAAGLRRGHRVGAALEAELPASAELMAVYADTALFLFGTIRDGYMWIFPKGEHLSVGIGAFRGGGRELRRALAESALRLGLPAEALRPRGHALPIYQRREPLQRGRTLLAGDAAGLMDPLSGEGIRHALTSGRLAAEAILAGDVAGYSQRAYDAIGRDLNVARRLAWLFYTCPRLCFRFGVGDTAVVGGMMQMLTGQASYRELERRVPGYYARKLVRR